MKKSDLIIPSKGLSSPIIIGSQVVAIDGSYTLSIVNKKLEHNFFGLNDNIHTVIAINVPCPTDYEKSINSLMSQNNCIVQDNETGVITFCSTINIVNIKHLLEDQPYKLK